MDNQAHDICSASPSLVSDARTLAPCIAELCPLHSALRPELVKAVRLGAQNRSQ